MKILHNINSDFINLISETEHLTPIGTCKLCVEKGKYKQKHLPPLLSNRN